MNGPCIFDDDFTSLRDPLIEADMALLQHPCTTLAVITDRSVIDRFYAICLRIMGGRRASLIATFWTADPRKASGIVESSRNMLSYLRWTDRGILLADGVNE